MTASCWTCATFPAARKLRPARFTLKSSGRRILLLPSWPCWMMTIPPCCAGWWRRALTTFWSIPRTSWNCAWCCAAPIACIRRRWNCANCAPRNLGTNRLDDLVGFTENMQEVFAMARKVAPCDVNVLITGETGTGKSMLGRALHRLSPRSGGAVHCLFLRQSARAPGGRRTVWPRKGRLYRGHDHAPRAV